MDWLHIAGLTAASAAIAGIAGAILYAATQARRRNASEGPGKTNEHGARRDRKRRSSQ